MSHPSLGSTSVGASLLDYNLKGYFFDFLQKDKALYRKQRILCHYSTATVASRT